MKKSLFALATGLLALFTLSGCGSDAQREAEVVSSFEESFQVNAMQEDPSAQSSSFYTDQSGTSVRRTPSTADGSSAGQTVQGTGGSTSDESTVAVQQQQVSPALRNAAQDVVQMMNSGQYASAVERLDQMMAAPNLSPDQWIAARNTMAEVQRRIITDPNISEAERERARAAVMRQ